MAREAERAEEQQSDSKYGALAPKKLPKGVVLGPDGKPYVARPVRPAPL